MCKKYNENKKLINITSTITPRPLLKGITENMNALKMKLFPRYRINCNLLIQLLNTIFSRALSTELFFIELNTTHVWTDGNGYYIHDLDALRDINWLFCKDPSDSEFLRKKVNRDFFNNGLKN